MTPDNAEESFKCSSCGAIYSRDKENKKECPVCGFVCTLTSCASLGASNEGY